MTTSDIGEKIKYLRRVKDISQNELSEGTGIVRSTISNYEIGRRTPHLKDLQKIADCFGVGLDYFGAPKDEAFNLLARAKEVFESPAVSKEAKEELYKEFMKLYLSVK